MADEPVLDDEGFDELGRRAGRALQEPPPEGGVARISERGRRQQTTKVVLACVGVLALVVGGIALLTTERFSGTLRPATTSTPPAPAATSTAVATTSPSTTSTSLATVTATVPQSASTESPLDARPEVVSLVASTGRSTHFTRGPSVAFQSAEGWKAPGFSADGKTLAVAMGDEMRLYDTADLRPLAELTCPVAGQPLPEEWNADARAMITAINAAGGVTTHRCRVSFSRDGSVAGMGSVVWDTHSGRSVTLPGDGVSIRPDGKQAVTGDTDGVRVWNTSTGALIAVLDSGNRRAAFDAYGHHIVATGREPASMWDALTLHKQGDLNGYQGLSAAFSADGRRVATATFGGVSVWDAATAKELLHVSCSGECFSVAMSSDAELVATGGFDGWPTVVDVVSGMRGLLTELNADFHTAAAMTFAFSPDGSRLAVATGLGIQIWLISH